MNHGVSHFTNYSTISSIVDTIVDTIVIVPVISCNTTIVILVTYSNRIGTRPHTIIPIDNDDINTITNTITNVEDRPLGLLRH